MEAVGFISAILSILRLTTGVASYVASVISASESIRRFSNEITSLHTVLTTLYEFTLSKHGALQKSGLDGPLKELAHELEELKAKFGVVEGEDGALASVRRGVERLKWPLRERETLRLTERVEKLRGLCLLAMAMDQMSVCIAVDGGGGTVADDVPAPCRRPSETMRSTPTLQSPRSRLMPKNTATGGSRKERPRS